MIEIENMIERELASYALLVASQRLVTSVVASLERLSERERAAVFLYACANECRARVETSLRSLSRRPPEPPPKYGGIVCGERGEKSPPHRKSRLFHERVWLCASCRFICVRPP